MSRFIQVTAFIVMVWAQKEKRPDIGNFAFWTAKGNLTGQFVPGLNAVLLLSDDQGTKLHVALEETMRSESVQSAGRTLKTDPNASEAQKEAARKTIQDARDELARRVASVLTPEQKTLIEKVNVAFFEAHRSVAGELETEFAGAKGNEEATKELQKRAREKQETEFMKRLGGILNPQQQAALTRAAEEEKRRDAEAAAKKESGV